MATSEHESPRTLLAYVLHHYDWSETSLIVELFTRTQGRVVVAAKGAKRPTSQLRPILLPFQPVLAHLGKAPADEQAEVRTLRTAASRPSGRSLPHICEAKALTRPSVVTVHPSASASEISAFDDELQSNTVDAISSPPARTFSRHDMHKPFLRRPALPKMRC